MSARDPMNWLRVFEGKSDAALANFLLSDLVGYRETSIHRDTDVQQVLAFITAIRLDQVRQLT